MEITTEKIEKFFNSYIISDDKIKMNSILYLIDNYVLDEIFEYVNDNKTSEEVKDLVSKLRLIQSMNYENSNQEELDLFIKKYEFKIRYKGDAFTPNMEYVISIH